jgi:hypothetical protein
MNTLAIASGEKRFYIYNGATILSITINKTRHSAGSVSVLSVIYAECQIPFMLSVAAP